MAAGVGLLLAALALAASSSARARPLTTGFADGLFADVSPQVRDYWFDRTVDAGAGIVRIGLGWSGVANPVPPANPTNPADPGYDFSHIDAAVRDGAARGLQVMLTVNGAPGWAEGPDRPPTSAAPPGTWKPDPTLFAAFGRAVATRYSGAFRPSFGSPPLPPVRYYQAWNEPNLHTYLTPQWDRGRVASPAHYRRMLNAFYDAVKGVNGQNRVVTAGTAPYGTRRGGKLMRPLRFWRALLCLRTKRTGELEPRKCSDPPRFDIAAHHPITGAPRSRADHRDDAVIPDLRRLRRIIRKAERSGRALPRERHPLWVTEIWWESDPPDPAGVRVRKQARWIAEAFYLIWRQGVRTAILLKVRDEPTDPRADEGSLHSGVFYVDATPKPSFSATRFPFVTERRSRRKLIAWGRAPRSGRLVIERRGANGWRPLRGFAVTAGEAFTAMVPARRPARFRAVVGGESSLSWHQRR
ncbi:MAG: hypothetical protein ACRDK9_03715 [Solirubrobacterales bacterium]